MTRSEALAIIKDAIKYSSKDAKNMQNAIAHIGTHFGWDNDNVMQNFVDFCLEGAEKWKANPMNTYMLKENNAASNVALYIDRQAANDITEFLRDYLTWTQI